MIKSYLKQHAPADNATGLTTVNKKKPSQQRAEVKQAFLQKKKLRAGNLYSDGKSLWSYGWWEVARWVRGRVVIRKGRAYSRTTELKHRRKLPGTPAKIETPMEQARMNL